MGALSPEPGASPVRIESLADQLASLTDAERAALIAALLAGRSTPV